ncbi:MAG: DUF4363 family protein [Eubacteriales bacterium]|nr:DUF4363 family protein [Eubacteriales bacterium]
MKREIGAAGLLLLLILVALWSIGRTDFLTGQIGLNLDRSERAARQGDYPLAQKAAENALSLWRSARGFTAVFLRHPDLDGVADAFYDLQERLQQRDRSALDAAYARLRYHLETLDWMEHLSPGTLF